MNTINFGIYWCSLVKKPLRKFANVYWLTILSQSSHRAWITSLSHIDPIVVSQPNQMEYGVCF